MKFISDNQLFAIMLTFIIGNSTIYPIGIEAKQDAWIAVLLALLMGIILIKVYLQIQASFPDKNLIEIIEVLLGRFISTPLGLLYTCYFLYISLLNLFNISIFLNSRLLENASLSSIQIMILIIILYLLFLGIETMARFTEVITYFLIIPLVIMGILLIIGSGQLNFDNLKPILNQGLQPIIKVSFSQILTFPFGDMITFLMIWHYIKSRDYLNEISFTSTIIGGILICLSIINMITVLGVKLTQQTNIPIMSISTIINLGEIIHGIDPLVAIILFITGIIKLAFTCYASVLSFTSTFKIRKRNPVLILFILALIIIATNSFNPVSFQIFLKESPENYIQLIFELAIPIILLLLCYQKKKKSV